MECSIVMAVYNPPPSFAWVLESIRLQKPAFDYEIIVVDDGSDVPCKDLCEFFGAHYYYDPARPFYSNSAKARNRALKMAIGRVLIMQSADVLHHTANTIERLVTDLRSGQFHISTVYNAIVDDGGQSTSELKTITRVRRDVQYTGLHNRRPLFFLGSAFRDDVYAIGGNDEDFVYPGYEDEWLGDCLTKGRALSPFYRDDVVGFHLDHPRGWTIDAEMRKLISIKRSRGVFCSSGGAWET